MIKSQASRDFELAHELHQQENCFGLTENAILPKNHEMIHGYLFLTNNNRDRDGHGPEFCKHMDRINKAAGTRITIYHSFHDEVKLYQQHWWRCNGPCQKRAPYFGTVRRAMNRAPGPTDFWWKEHQQNCGGQFIKIKEPENFKARGSKNKEKQKPVAKNNRSTNNMFNWLKKPTATATTTVTIPKFTSTPKNTNTQNSLTTFKKLGNSTNNVHGWGTAGPNGSNNSQKTTTSVSNTPKFSSSGILGGSNIGYSNLLTKFDSNSKKHESNTNIKKSGGRIDTFISPKAKKPSVNKNQSSNEVDIKLVECPICSNFVSNEEINKHVDSCLITANKETTAIVNSTTSQAKTDNSLAQKRKIDTITFVNKQPKLDTSENTKMTNCPVCHKTLELKDINEHLDKCLLDTSKQDNDLTDILDDRNYKNDTINESVISLNSTSSDSSSSSLINEDAKDENKTETASHKCLVCNVLIPPEVSLNDHLEDCIGSVFNDDSSLSNCDDIQMSETISDISFDHSDKYPCPVCMQLVSESSMNQHLDVCLKNS
ncbi:DNA-dependent metalloprotease SPRTN isoform X2 [Calliopsis andreniformis]|uniref:DNA-dependent metalloprotease SPRTN isoform X2 n=1 Tax=Calliopsis andreniformis TaxID=337506 RepID=UPI003FCDFB92